MNLFYEETFANDFIYKSISTFLYVVWDSLASNFFKMEPTLNFLRTRISKWKLQIEI